MANREQEPFRVWTSIHPWRGSKALIEMGKRHGISLGDKVCWSGLDGEVTLVERENSMAYFDDVEDIWPEIGRCVVVLSKCPNCMTENPRSLNGAAQCAKCKWRPGELAEPDPKQWKKEGKEKDD